MAEGPKDEADEGRKRDFGGSAENIAENINEGTF